MAIYVVEIFGKNFHVAFDGIVKPMGFITFRVVDSKDISKAENDAIQLMRKDESLREIIKNPSDDPPTMDVQKIYQYEDATDWEIGEGIIWFEMNPKRWWQFWRR